jgi:hypothetical protein
MIQLPGQADVEAAARSLGLAGYEVARPGRDALAADPWGTKLRLTTV